MFESKYLEKKSNITKLVPVHPSPLLAPMADENEIPVKPENTRI